MTHAIVMAGGGAAAAFQVGVLMGIDRRKVPVDAVYGTSAGALNAACFGFSGAPALVELWHGIKSWRDLWSINYWAMVLRGSGVMNSKPLRRKIDDHCRDWKARVKVCVTKVDMLNGDLVYSYSGDPDFCESVEASAALPGIISPIGGRYSDGGIREVLPLKRAIDEGHDHISVILCHPWSRSLTEWRPNDGFMGFVGAALRADSIRGHEVLKDDINTAIVTNCNPAKRKIDISIYAPNREILDCLDFIPDKIEEAIEEGLKAQPTCYPAMR
jgi:NTE family protein